MVQSSWFNVRGRLVAAQPGAQADGPRFAWPAA